MKNRILIIRDIFLILIPMLFLVLGSCSNDSNVIEDENGIIDDNEISNNTSLETKDIDALLFMLEEEKLARDTYTYLGNLWSINQFNNIKKSEQTHMDAIISLLSKNNIDYNILAYGEFENKELQEYYNVFIDKGSMSQANALQIGATIEDLDIVDLENFISKISNSSIISVFENLQCGSRNHLRSFVKSIDKNGANYVPQYLSLDDYTSILSSSQEKCNSE